MCKCNNVSLWLKVANFGSLHSYRTMLRFLYILVGLNNVCVYRLDSKVGSGIHNGLF